MTVPPPEAKGDCEEKITLETIFSVWLNSCSADDPLSTLGALTERIGPLPSADSHPSDVLDVSDPGEAAPLRASVTWFDPVKGFGFVAPQDGTTDAFLHISVLNRAGLHEIGEGAELLCRVVPGAKGPQVADILDVLSTGTTAESRNARHDAASGAEEELTGTVKWFKPEQGFGFVIADDGAKDVFVHKSVLRRCNLTGLESGQRVLLRARAAPKGREASWVVLL
ncbi:Cold shock protein of CSP family _ dimer [Azospirillum argentinense]|uniref:CSD domain-containing protein n=1 Tax=Azospirillum argentinense TaxID=2970906 RepID=A0A5B0L1A9_9PROT|nr:Cold shock protein of CSP family [Azospirillum argentinense]